MMNETRKKQIILVRHAKSIERNDWEGKDFDRPLIDKGRDAIGVIAKYLLLIGTHPDIIISSPAVRTQQTAEVLEQKFKNKPSSSRSLSKLYNEGKGSSRNGTKIHLDVIRKLDEEHSIVMIVGHNPDLTEFASYLSGEHVPSLRKGSLVVLAVPDGLEWSHIKKGSLDLVYYLTPQFLQLEDLAEE